jgi:hypothetical protein
LASRQRCQIEGCSRKNKSSARGFGLMRRWWEQSVLVERTGTVHLTMILQVLKKPPIMRRLVSNSFELKGACTKALVQKGAVKK